MKNVVGLANAMRLVESACDKGEITIIGEGGLPSPVELYNKCVAFINKEYGVDILNLVAQTSMRKDCGDCCCDCCCDDDDEDCEMSYLDVEDIVQEIGQYLDDTILTSGVVEDIMDKIEEYFNVIDFVADEDYSGIKRSMYIILDKQTDGIVVSGGIINADEIVEVILEIVKDNTK